MHQSNLSLLQAFSDYISKDLAALTNSLIDVNKVLVTITKSFSEEQIEDEFWKQHLEILLVKYTFHSFTLLEVINGTETKDCDDEILSFPDMPSIRILLRALIENYLTIYYLIFEPKNSAEGEFRFYLYQLSGLNARQKFIVQTAENAQQLKDEKDECGKLENLIENNRYFKSLKGSIRKDILKRKNARIYGWEKMIENSDLHAESITQTWKLFSNTAHSELLGTIQLRDYILQPQYINSAICSDIFIAIRLTSSLITNLKDNYFNAQKIFNQLSNDKITKLQLWTQLARQKNDNVT